MSTSRRLTQRLVCVVQGCNQTFRTQYGHTQHINAKHTGIDMQPSSCRPELVSCNSERDAEQISSPSFMDIDDEPTFSSAFNRFILLVSSSMYIYNLCLLVSLPCDSQGNFLPTGTPPSSPVQPENVAEPFMDPLQFRIADFLFRKVEMSQGNINELMELWTLTMLKHGDFGPFENHDEMYKLIDAIQQGSAPWKCFVTQVDANLPPTAPSWQCNQYQIWYHDPDMVISNILANPDFSNEFDTAPYVEVSSDGKRWWCDFMSGNFAWRHASRIHQEDPTMAGAMYVGIILGSDKTTVSVAMSNVEYYPLYISIGNIHNSAWHGHRNAVVPIGFLAIPKSDRKYDDDPVFRTFKKQLYHQSIAVILQSLKPAMMEPVIRRCPDGHFRRVIYNLASFIADYPEQVLLSGIVSRWCTKCTALSSDLDGEGGRHTQELTQLLLDEFRDESDTLWYTYGIDKTTKPFTFHFLRADIHEILTSDLLHQVIKGSFKDHLVEWVGEYLLQSEGKDRAREIMDDIDRRIAATPAFPGFLPGLKVYLPAVADYLPEEMMQCLASFLDFCYLVCRTDFNEDTILEVESAMARFHYYRQVFITTGVRDTISLPRQHSLVHYWQHIIDFGASNSLCSSITESRHITAVKKPWCRSNRYNALSQMLLTNQQLDKLAALRSELVNYGLVTPNHPPPPDPFDLESEDVGAVDELILAEVKLAVTKERAYPRRLERLAQHIHCPDLPELNDPPSEDIHLDDCPEIMSNIYVYHSAVASFYAPSDISRVRGMRRERIRSTPSWHKRPCHDCAFVVKDEEKPGFSGMSVVRILLFFSFVHEGVTYPCALVQWFKKHGQHADKKTGLWIVKPEVAQGRPVISVIHLDSLFRGAHIIPMYGTHSVPHRFDYTYSLDCFKAFYVNKYADHHTNEIIFS
ncbi:uncharacterized protein EV420DRAFT_1619442 [Desarmillaria tabescens]|uniref:C2H2-type domain-containing protein n=1 Tax=Armillaria tabescens TaxID=1929756 RepID=A0AA39N8C4_ARMTA|nr:uncharacterized protein EV420DRAFT_1619442 [Desarmillaria tabescens]KAK0460894.1 hypothetical protein EV420DRAFT_1619442 [Desarmillaria tabescens]